MQERGGEAVATARDRFDYRGFLIGVVEGFAEEGDVAGKSDFLDGGIGPDEAHEFRLLDDLAVAFEKYVESIRDFREERNAFFATKKEALVGVVAEGAEAQDHGRLLASRNERRLRNGCWIPLERIDKILRAVKRGM